MKASELREHGAQIAGRVRWREGEAPPGPEDTDPGAEKIPSPPPPTTPVAPKWQAVEPAAASGSSSLLRTILVFLLHVGIAFVAGALLLGVAAVVASLTSDGRVALLEVRGLPILIAGSAAIVVFSLLRTGPKAGDRRTVALSVVTGFLVLVAAVAFLYRPSLMADAQRSLDRQLGVFGPEVSEAVDRFTGDVDQWNREVDNYRTDLVAVTQVQRTEADQAKREAATREFSVVASGLEAGLDGINKRMTSHASAIEQQPLRDALGDLAGVFKDELAGIRLLTRGFVSNDQTMIQSGDTTFKDATARAVELFEERVEPLLERAEIDAGPLAAAVGELRG
jgi:hypothetical protein